MINLLESSYLTSATFSGYNLQYMLKLIMIDTKLRNFFQPLFNQMARPLVKLHVKPDTISWSALLLGISAGLCLALKLPVWAFILLWLSGLLDVLDGTVAVLTGQSAKTGAYLDLILDRMVEASVILGFAWAFPNSVYVCLLFFIKAKRACTMILALLSVPKLSLPSHS